jgi:hypothetical protein
MIPATLAPQIEGSTPIQSQPEDFLRAFERRVQAGLLTGYPHRRSIYRALHVGPGHLHVSAGTWWTAINVGLNELDLVAEEPGSVRYRVWYWRWARFVLGLSGSLGAIGLVLMQIFDVRGYIARHPSTTIPGLSLDQNLQIAWSLVVFWGFVAPWLLIAIHKGPVRRLVARLIAEVDRSRQAASRSAS